MPGVRIASRERINSQEIVVDIKEIRLAAFQGLFESAEESNECYKHQASSTGHMRRKEKS